MQGVAVTWDSRCSCFTVVTHIIITCVFLSLSVYCTDTELILLPVCLTFLFSTTLYQILILLSWSPQVIWIFLLHFLLKIWLCTCPWKSHSRAIPTHTHTAMASEESKHKGWSRVIHNYMGFIETAFHQLHWQRGKGGMSPRVTSLGLSEFQFFVWKPQRIISTAKN